MNEYDFNMKNIKRTSRGVPPDDFIQTHLHRSVEHVRHNE